MLVVFGLLAVTGMALGAEDKGEEAAGRYILGVDEERRALDNRLALAEWKYASHLTPESLTEKLELSAESAKVAKQRWQETIKYPWQGFKNETLKRMFQQYSVLGMAALPEEKNIRYEKIISEMMSIYSKAKICDFRNKTKCDLSLEPELSNILAKSRDPEELKHVWVEWRNASGKKCRSLFTEYVGLANEGARLNNFTDSVGLWNEDFEDPNFEKDLSELWKQLEPFYKQLHAYVRRRLSEKYGEEIVSRKGPIPAHLLGNMWAQSWGNILDITIPYPGKESTDVTPNMIKQGYNAEKMFKVAEEFFTSINMSAMVPSFWENSILEKPTDRDIVCHASAWDFYDGKDFRIKQCTNVNGEDLYTVHHEMGHVEYFMEYKHQPAVFRGGANSGFHEAVGDTIALSVATPAHLAKIGLLEAQASEDREALINQLFQTALEKIAFLPFGYLMDLWRWDVFHGKITPDDYNCQWWKLRNQFQGVEPPVERSEQDFDPAAKYHTVSNVPYIRYFVSFVIQFQFHKALCIEAGQFNPKNPEAGLPLYNCDIYKNTNAGNLLKKMLALGSSKPWPEAMEVITGQRKMDVGPLLEYFSPLVSWLEAENAKTAEFIGWQSTPNNKCTRG